MSRPPDDDRGSDASERSFVVRVPSAAELECRTLGFTLGDLTAVYEHKLAGIDPRAGHDAPVCPTPEALAHLAELNAEWAELQARALRRRLWRRPVG